MNTVSYTGKTIIGTGLFTRDNAVTLLPKIRNTQRTEQTLSIAYTAQTNKKMTPYESSSVPLKRNVS